MSDDFSISLTNDGLEVYYSLKPLLDSIDFSFDSEGKTEISWSMKCESTINLTLRKYIDSNQKTKKILRSVFLKMDAVNLFLKYLYIIQRIKTIKKAAIYEDFFNAPFVIDYLDRHGLDIPTEEVIRRRVPFLINILDSLGIINQSSSEIEIQTFVTSKEVLRINSKEHDDIVNDRIQRLLKFSSVMTRVPAESKIEIAAEDGKTYSLKNDPREYLSSEEISFLKESFGKEFLTEKYHLKIEDI
jgi:hypothetical protein